MQQLSDAKRLKENQRNCQHSIVNGNFLNCIDIQIA